MRLDNSFIKLCCLFDGAKMLQEVSNLPDHAWRTHPQGFEGNSAVSLIARSGNSNDDRTYGPMEATEWLAQLPYITTILSTLKAPLGRCRLMKITGNSKVPKHTDLDYYWQRRMRIHIPVLTNKTVHFECGSDVVHMAEGEAWVFDTTQLHTVQNSNESERIHLVIDTVGSTHIFNLFPKQISTHINENKLTPTGNSQTIESLSFESVNRPLIMSPFEQREILSELLDMFSTSLDSILIESIKTSLYPVMLDWQATWSEHGLKPTGFEQFERLQQELDAATQSCTKDAMFRGSPVSLWLKHWLILPAIDTEEVKNQRFPSVSKTNKMEDSSKSFASQYTDSMPALLTHLAGTLVVSTYASNRLVLLRSDGTELNTHFKDYPGPMGWLLKNLNWH